MTDIFKHAKAFPANETPSMMFSYLSGLLSAQERTEVGYWQDIALAIAMREREAGKVELLERLIDYKNEACKTPRWHQFKVNSEGVELVSVGEFNEMSVQGWDGYLSAEEAVNRITGDPQ